MNKFLLFSTILLAVLTGCKQSRNHGAQETTGDQNNVTTSDQGKVRFSDEGHFKNITQLTFGGDNAEAYWSFDDSKLTFQANHADWNTKCDQIFLYDLDKAPDSSRIPPMISTGKGRTTCSYFLPGDSLILYASTHGQSPDCPPPPEQREDGKYVWPIYDSYDIYLADIHGHIRRALTDTPGYDAEATVSQQGDKIVFTSMRTGDLELFTMNLDGSDVRQVTDELGYDGGAFFSPDGTKLVFRASRPKTDEEKAEYKKLLSEGLVMPTKMEVFVCNVDGSDLRQVTSLGQANWCPFFHPSGNRIIFSSNYTSEHGFPFNLYMINTDGTGLERITHDGVFDAFPMFSNDGTRLVFSSNRNSNGAEGINLFLAEWQD